MAAGFPHQTLCGSMWISKTYILAFSNHGIALMAETGAITNVVACPKWFAVGVATTAAAVRAGGRPGPAARWWWWWYI